MSNRGSEHWGRIVSPVIANPFRPTITIRVLVHPTPTPTFIANDPHAAFPPFSKLDHQREKRYQSQFLVSRSWDGSQLGAGMVSS